MVEHPMIVGNFPQFTQFDPETGALTGASVLERRLSDLQGYFADETAYAQSLQQTDALLYRVTTVEPAQGEGALHHCISTILPGRVGREYYMTKGHYHAWRPAAEYYMGLRGTGIVLLEDERTGQAWANSLPPNGVVYIPGYAAHRTVNTGMEPLIFLCVYSANAGHDYGAIQARNFQQVVVDVAGEPVIMARTAFLASLIMGKPTKG